MKKWFSAVFFSFCFFPCIIFAGNFSKESHNVKSEAAYDSASVKNINIASNYDKNARQTQFVNRTAAAFNEFFSETGSVESQADSSDLKNTGCGNNREFSELCDFLCSVRSSLGECADFKTTAHQMYFITR